MQNGAGSSTWICIPMVYCFISYVEMLSWNNAISCNTDLNTEGGYMPSKLEKLFKSKPYILIQI